jgi:hypothetical protein
MEIHKNMSYWYFLILRGISFTIENFHVISLLLKQATVCPALKTRKLLVAINLQLINTFINFHKFINLHFFQIIIFFKLIFSPYDSLNGFVH